MGHVNPIRWLSAIGGGIVATPSAHPAPEASGLANRLRVLREREFSKLTQSDLAKVLSDAEGTLSTSAISMWEKPGSGRIPPQGRLVSYAQLFCTPRSFEGGARMLGMTELTAAELDRFEELKEELFDLRDKAVSTEAEPASGGARSLWHFPDGSRITLVCSRLPAGRRPPSADPESRDYVRFSGLADLDALIEVYGAVKAHNPTSRVVITAAQDLTKRDTANHLVLIGGMAWEAVPPGLSSLFSLPIESGDPADRGAIVVHDEDGTEREFKCTFSDDGTLVEDVGFFARGENPAAPRRTLTICGGVTTRGVLGAAQCFIDWEMREHNEQYLIPRFPGGSTYCIVMRVPIVNGYPLTPDLSREENRLFEWSSDVRQPGADGERE
jgi:hypothetical protein